MANGGILWQLVGNVDPLGQYSKGLQQYNQQQNILQQLAGQEQDRQFRQQTDARNFERQTSQDAITQRNWEQQFAQNAKNQDQMRAIQQQQLALAQAQFKRGEVPAGYEVDPSNPGVLRPRQGGPQDPETIRKLQQAQREPVAPQWKEIEVNGQKTLVRINPDNTVVAPDIQGTVPQQTNPYSNGKMTDAQSNAALYATRMAQSNDILGRYNDINKGLSGWAGGVISNIAPSGVTNNLISADRQQLVQAQRDFINAVLRRESGAVISPSEFENAAKQYFPQPGDSEQVIQQKAQNRRTAITGIMGAAGPHYQPPQNYRQQPQQQQTQQQQNGPITAVNPQTGQRIQFQNGQWVPMQ